MDTPPATMADRALGWGERPDISARSVLVTILGDTVALLGGTVWLTDLITLASPFGFNERLVRTSMFRLVAERWVTNERIGRRSRYSLTAFARDEFADADARIFRRTGPDWDGLWTLVFVASGPDDDAQVVRHLRWRGFAEITKGVYARPNSDIATTRQLFDRLEISPYPLVASARFDEIGGVIRTGPFRDRSGLAAAEDSYREFVDLYQRIPSVPAGQRRPKDAFVLRTMLIHDLRRTRLRDPELPSELLPNDWVGRQALDLAGSMYRSLGEPSWQWVETVTGLTVDPTDPRLARRFATAA